MRMVNIRYVSITPLGINDGGMLMFVGYAGQNATEFMEDSDEEFGLYGIVVLLTVRDGVC